MKEPRIQKAMRVDFAELRKEYGDADYPYLVYMVAFRTAIALRSIWDPVAHKANEESNHDDLQDKVVPKIMNIIYDLANTPEMKDE